MASQPGRTHTLDTRSGRLDEQTAGAPRTAHRVAGVMRQPVQGLRIAGVAGTLGGVLVVAGSLLPWLEIDAGLQGLAGTRGVNGQALLVGGAAMAALGIASVIVSTDPLSVLAPDAAGGPTGPRSTPRARRLRFALGATSMAVLAFVAWLLPRLFASEAQLAATGMFMPALGPGLFVALAGATLAAATLLLPTGAGVSRDASARPPRRRVAPSRFSLTVKDPRRLAQIVLASLWLLDAALQFQPYMFSRGFAQALVVQDSQGATGLLIPVALVTHVMVPHAALANALFANVQLLIALGILWSRTLRPALVASVLWAGGVWSIGEGFGGLLATGADPLTGAPGAALLYIGAAVLAWPWRAALQEQGKGTWKQVRRLGDLLWASWWLIGAALMVQPVLDGPGAARSVLLGAAVGMPGPIAALDRALASASTGAGLPIALALLVAQAAIGFGVLRRRSRPFSLALGSMLALGLWVTTQSLGGIPTGMGTDPNSGPVLVALALLLVQPAGRAPLSGSNSGSNASAPVSAAPAAPLERQRSRREQAVRRLADMCRASAVVVAARAPSPSVADRVVPAALGHGNDCGGNEQR